MELIVSTKSLRNTCRTCLTYSESLTHLNNCIKYNEDTNETITIQNMLEAILCQEVDITDEKHPNQICQMCLSLLKLSYSFRQQFKTCQTLLENVKFEDDQDIVANETIEENSKFNDFKDVIIIEESVIDNEDFTNTIIEEFDTIPENENIKIIIENSDELNLPQKFQHNDDNNKNKYLKLKTIRKQFNFTKKMKSKIRNEGGFVSELCEICGFLASTVSSAYHHRNKHKPKVFKCKFCSKGFAVISYLNTHLNTIHTNTHNFLCSICGKSHTSNSDMVYHLRLHNNDKRYKCSFCDKKFIQICNLKRHLRTHTKEKPYKCSFCNKVFASTSEVKKHENVHTHEKQYHCEICNKVFLLAWRRNLHYLTHEGPFECFICDRTFLKKQYLSYHLHKVHQVKNLDQKSIVN